MFKKKIVLAHMRVAAAYAETSVAERLKVGAVIVNRHSEQPIAMGYNGRPAHHDNCCEVKHGDQLVTHPDVIHAEVNALRRLPPNTNCGELALFVTDSPCPNCAHTIVEAGIKQVFFAKMYRLLEGVSILLEAGVEVFQIWENGEIYTVSIRDSKQLLTPAGFDKDNRLIDGFYESIHRAEAYGLGRHKSAWSVKDREECEKMFLKGCPVEEICAKLDRSMGAVCSVLNGLGHLSFKARIGYMKSVGPRQRVLWCCNESIRANLAKIHRVAEERSRDLMKEYKRLGFRDFLNNLDSSISPHMALKTLTKVGVVRRYDAMKETGFGGASGWVDIESKTFYKF